MSNCNSLVPVESIFVTHRQMISKTDGKTSYLPYTADVIALLMNIFVKLFGSFCKRSDSNRFYISHKHGTLTHGDTGQ